MSQRIAWVDWNKAILICLVVLGHAGSIFYPIIYLFHIPAFFFISGYLCNYEKAEAGSLRKSGPLIAGILLYNVLFMVVNAVYAFTTGVGIMHAVPGTSFEEIVIKPITGVVCVYYPSAPYSNPLCAQLWFVWVLVLLRLVGQPVIKMGGGENKAYNHHYIGLFNLYIVPYRMHISFFLPEQDSCRPSLFSYGQYGSWAYCPQSSKD